MKALIQRVTSASVSVDHQLVAAIEQGILAFIGIEKTDNEEKANQLLHKLLSYRIFIDDKQKMNHNLCDIQGGLLLVSQFTLVANTRKGLRPSFSEAAKPKYAKALYEYLVEQAAVKGCAYQINTQCGIFAADMKVSLINDGPVTFLLET